MTLIRVTVSVIVGVFITAVLLFAFAPVYEPIVSFVAEDSSVESHGWDGIPESIEQSALMYVGVIFIIGLVVLAVVRILREELVVTPR